MGVDHGYVVCAGGLWAPRDLCRGNALDAVKRIRAWQPLDRADWVGDLLYVPESLYCIGLTVVMLGGRDLGALTRRSHRSWHAKQVGLRWTRGQPHRYLQSKWSHHYGANDSRKSTGRLSANAEVKPCARSLLAKPARRTPKIV